MSKGSGFTFPKNGRRLLAHGLTGLTLGTILGLALFSFVGLPQVPEPPWSGVSSQYALSRFSSLDELRDFLNKSGSSMDWYYYESGAKGVRFAVPSVAPTFGTAVESLADESYEFSQTNIQVEGVDEADIIKTDGEYIYLVSGQRLIIVRAYPPESAEVLSEISFNGTIRGLFINGDRLVVFREDYEVPDYPSERKTSEMIIIPIWLVETRLLIYNLEDRERPILAREISVNGSYFTSRMIGNNVYLLVTQPAGVLEGEVYLPTISYDDRSEKVEALRVYYSNVSDSYYAFTTVVAVDIMNVEAPKYEVFLVGATSAVYVSMNNIYVAIPKMPVFNEEEPVSEMTEIHRIRIAEGDIEYEASGAVPGRVLNQFSMDEHSGHFRIATTTGQLWWTPGEATSKNHVYVLNMNLNITGKIEDIAPGETIYSARFMGERCYLVTFKKIDPFFVIDLRDPANPQILGKLKITGYSDYLHPYDENLIIGIGKETVEAEEGDFAWYQGVKISLFDVSDVENPIEIDKYEIGDRGTDSPILRDHKALLFDKEKNLLAIPVLVAEINEEQYPNG
ncbi:MAG: beta-propeller domain-containing protein, partial [Candidatus Bathyarchaeia archaeon]